MKHTLSIIVNDQAGVLTRIAGMFNRRGFNIDSITVGRTEGIGLSRMTIVVHGDQSLVEQVKKQLHKQIDVHKVMDITNEPIVTRELVMVKVRANPASLPEITNLVEPFRTTVVDVSHNTITIQATGDEDKLNAMIELLRPYGIKDLVRTGFAAIQRG
ncbi:acetolactate synthase small subunit [Tepidibacillus infernus]|uniref:Acetolactate synthase small subunit n=1 Tax=Tepidibacillus decaturensis TaxID=1413211 RepID=A0A135L529_9BACI|nr:MULTISPECIES: acetolactate synthase small subunit [Tepidibacillus]KXG44040.1 acetolactate synthase small subunit [Tepidibacillus decaturensis]GBF10427.1 putative acetolactate synthase small subunit [Tepidibacillus sp. HK-1]